MSEKANITPSVLKWARETARISEEAAAAKVSVRLERIIAWECGEEVPTINQAMTLAKAYKRPFALLFLPKIPRDFTPLKDFRKNHAQELSTGSVFIIREVQQKQSWISETNKENNEDAMPFVGKFSLQDKPEVVARDILDTLGIYPGDYKTENPIKEWITNAEVNGIFVSRTSFIHSRLTLDSEEIQGFAIADPFAPFVFVNSDDWNAPQLFTLVHELAHLWIAETGISNDVYIETEDRINSNPVELFCNEVAACALMPAVYLKDIFTAELSGSTGVYRVAKKFGVSSIAFLVRARNLQLLTKMTYQQLRKEADLGYQDFLQKEALKKALQKTKSGGPDYFLLQVNRNGRLFTQTVLDAYRGGIIQPTEASRLLNVQVNKFPKLEAQIYK